MRPLGRCVAQTGLADATGQAAFDCRLDKIRRNERHRDRHVDMTNAVQQLTAYSITSSARASLLFLPRACDHFLDVADAQFAMLRERVDQLDCFPPHPRRWAASA